MRGRATAYGQCRRASRDLSSGAEPVSLDSLTSAPTALYSMSHCLLSAYAGGNLFQVQRSSDSTTQNIGHNPTTMAVDLAALAAFCTGTDGFVTSLYDQSGGARTITAAGALRPKVWDSVSGAVLIGTALAASYDGTTDQIGRADAFGLSGATALSVGSVATWTKAIDTPSIFAIGTDGARARQLQYMNTTTQLVEDIFGSSRTMTCSALNSGTQNLLTRLAAGAGIGTIKVRQNGTELSELSSVNPANTLNLGTTNSNLGNGQRFAAFPAFIFQGKVGTWCVWGANISDADAAVWDSTMTAIYG